MRPWLRPLAAALMLWSGAALAEIRINIEGVDGDLRRNVLTFLSVERYRQRAGVDEDTMTRLFNRIDEEVRGALRPFGYYEPAVRSTFGPEGNGWHVDISITRGPVVRITKVNIEVTGPGANDSQFTALADFPLISEGMTLNHGLYEQAKGELTRTAAANGYLDARLLRSQLLVDPQAHTAQIDLALETGPQYRFGQVAIEQSVIRPELMQRFLRFKQGDPYSVTQLLRTQFALDDSLYFAAVEVSPGERDPQTLTVPISITASKSRRQFTIGAGYGTDTSVRGTIGWTDSRVNDRGHRLRIEFKASTILQRLDARYDIPIGDPALEKFSLDAISRSEILSDLNTQEYTLKPSVTQVRGLWQRVFSLAATHTVTNKGAVDRQSANLLVPGITYASVPEGFLGEALFSREFYAELIGSHSVLGSDADFLRLLLQSERDFDLSDKWHVLLRGQFGVSLVRNFGDLPGIYRFFAGGDRSVRGFAYNSLSPQEYVAMRDGTTELQKTGGRNLIVGSAELVRDLPRNLAVATFFDIGNAFNRFGDPMEYSAGVGLRYRLPVVSIGLDIAQPLSRSGSPRLHLNISPKL
ncbi:MAG: BamA/TamA family outer membrane protein [Steroidobacteraceae bacterium]